MDRFLDMIGQRVTLAEHSGYRGGLDTQFGQTGQHSVYTEHLGKEIMYHVATLLPFSETDSQQLQRIGHKALPGARHQDFGRRLRGDELWQWCPRCRQQGPQPLIRTKRKSASKFPEPLLRDIKSYRRDGSRLTKGTQHLPITDLAW